ncbi:MAG: hypothetical protein GF329_08440 [Candidatus Lokiarchaeota archaeon]|nr:hypothetical protein [Candidatus Lokiarchaeota archaeon]
MTCNLLLSNNLTKTHLTAHKGYARGFLNKLVKFLRKPLIKAKKGEIYAYKSGARSAIYPKNGKFYRIKGCGMDEKGFIYEKYETFLDENTTVIKKRLRGCQFEGTCKKELEITEELSKIFEQKKLFFPNQSLGYWVYETELDRVPYAGLYETFGDIRLNDDLLYFLEARLESNLSKYTELLQLYYKIGLQVGHIKKVMNDAGYLWGTFFGKDDRIFHSNAHINNIVVAIKNNNVVLGPLDFDLAYRLGELKGKTFEHKVEDEKQVLEASIKGWDIFTPKIKIFNFSRSKKLEHYRQKLRENLFQGFINGSKEHIHQIKSKQLLQFL